MSLDDHRALVRRYYEDAPYHPDVCDEIFAPRFSFHTLQHASLTVQVAESTPAAEKAAYEQIRSIWGGWHITIDEMIAEGDRVMVRWTSGGRQVGEFSGLPPTGNQVTYAGINIFRIADGKIAEVWDLYDRLWMWQQLGVLPGLKAAIAQAAAPAAVRIEHIALWTAQLEELKSFYETYFGATAGAKHVNPAHEFESYFLTFAGGPRLELMCMPGVRDLPRDADMQYMGYVHIAISVGSVERVDALTAQLRVAGYRIAGEPRRTSDGYYESVALDPDGNRVEITE
jgi:lactoylglutathione lyase